LFGFSALPTLFPCPLMADLRTERVPEMHRWELAWVWWRDLWSAYLGGMLLEVQTRDQRLLDFQVFLQPTRSPHAVSSFHSITYSQLSYLANNGRAYHGNPRDEWTQM